MKVIITVIERLCCCVENPLRCICLLLSVTTSSRLAFVCTLPLYAGPRHSRSSTMTEIIEDFRET